MALLGQLRGVAQRVGIGQLPGPALRGAQVHGVIEGAVRVGHVHVDAQPGAAQGVEQRVLALVGQPDLRGRHTGQPMIPRHRPQEAEGAAHAWIGVVIQLHVQPVREGPLQCGQEGAQLIQSALHSHDGREASPRPRE